MDGRDKEALLFPQRIKDNTRKWELTKHDLKYFAIPVGREIDQFDELRQKYYSSTKRGGGTFKTFRDTMQPLKTFTQITSPAPGLVTERP